MMLWCYLFLKLGENRKYYELQRLYKLNMIYDNSGATLCAVWCAVLWQKYII